MELKVPNATLYYEVRGSGPTLVFIAGGPTDAGVFTSVATTLADRYRTVAYDPRGNSRSKFDAEPGEQDLDVHGDDVARLIEALGGAPAFVFGNSGGALIGLDATARHPAMIRALIAHEPPCVTLLPDAETVLAGMRHAREVGATQGAQAGFGAFMKLTGVDLEPPPGPPNPASARIGGNLDYFVRHGMMPLASYRPEIATLQASGKVTVGVGATSEGELAHRTALALAVALGKKPVVFPGGHGGYNRAVDEFAAVIHATLQG
jgi:pimeloyl-ACP methyl ester carboxylesterase